MRWHFRVEGDRPHDLGSGGGTMSLREGMSRSMRATSAAVERHYRVLLLLVLLLLAFYAWTRRFMMDDAFISFRYARNLVEGSGLVFNPGERIEGYTNFLWTLLLTVPFLARIDPVTFCFATGLVLFVLTLYLFSQLVLLCMESRPLALAGVLLLGLCPSFASFATGGLETMLVSCLVTAMVLLLFYGVGSSDGRTAR
jgi:arabinofuranosyltransferase